MPPNRFESEVESFLEGSHGDRTHIKRADHPRLHHYAGHYSKRIDHSTGLDPIPQHNTRNHAMKYYSPPLHTQHHAMKHLPPQHATNNQNCPLSPCRGELSFTTHTTHPHQGDISFNQQAQVLTKHKPHTTPQQQARNIANQQEPTEHQKRTACDITTTVGHPPPEISHVIRLDEVSTKSENVAIPTI